MGIAGERPAHLDRHCILTVPKVITLKKEVFIGIFAVVLVAALTLLFQFQQPVSMKQSVQLSDSVVAVIGTSYITLSELQQSFETAHPVLKQGSSSREQLYSVLTAMLAEKVISQEAIRLGFQRNKRIEQLHDEFQRNAMVEQVIAADVDSRITVSDEEANEEMMKSLVTFKFRYWMEPSRERAETIQRQMRREGYGAVVQQLIKQNPELNGVALQMESDYVRWTEIEPKFYEAIKTLSLGDISAPIEYGGAFYLLQIVDIRRSGVTTTQASNSLPTAKKIVFARKRLSARKAYVTALMEPKNVKTNAAALHLLVSAAEEWYASPLLNSFDFFSALEKADASYLKLQAFKKEQARILVTTSNTQFTMLEIARNLPLRKIMKEFQRPFAAFAAYTAAAVRDYYLERIGMERNYHNDLESSEYLRVWNDKWLYEEYRLKHTLQRNSPDDDPAQQDVRQYIVRKDQNYLTQKIDSFVQRYHPQVNTTVLDTLRMNEYTLSRSMPVSFIRGGKDVPAFPTVGNEWRNDISRLKSILKIQQSNNSMSRNN